MTTHRTAATPIRNAVVRTTVDDAFWSPRISVVATATVPHVFDELDRRGRIALLEAAARGERHSNADHGIADDSDVAKWVEAASRVVARNSDSPVAASLDRAVRAIAGAQQPDGYVNSYITVSRPEARWQDLRDGHEMYTIGHLIEAGVTHHEEMGDETLLDVARRLGDHLASTFGDGPGRRHGFCGHPEVELALFRLARATGDERYAELGRYFVEARGNPPDFFEREERERGTGQSTEYLAAHGISGEERRRYNQSHGPIREQRDAVGHAVRALYFYSGAADAARVFADSSLADACERLWESVERQTYATGGIGSSAHNEGFTREFDLPNDTAYAETCAAIAHVNWGQRMLRLNLDGRYADAMERALYNAVLGGVSLDGRRFFYDDPLETRVGKERQPWFDVACCPPNVARTIPGVGDLAYGADAHGPIVHLFIDGAATFDLGGDAVTIEQSTRYPWGESTSLTVRTAQPMRFALRVRVPSWCGGARLSVNGDVVDTAVTRGYATVEREWRDGDVVEMHLPMPVERVHADPRVDADRGRVALRRGPIVYCIEHVDSPAPVDQLVVPPDVWWTATFDPDLLGGVVALHAQLPVVGGDERVPVRAIPFFAWANREPGAMRVWLRESAG